MASEIFEMSELCQRVMRVLFESRQTAEPRKADAELTVAEIAARLDAPPADVEAQLNLLDGLGYVNHVVSYGGDPTVIYRRIPIEAAIERPAVAHSYFLSEFGKTVVLPLLQQAEAKA